MRDQLYHCGVGAADGGGVELAMQASCEIKIEKAEAGNLRIQQLLRKCRRWGRQ